MGADRYKKTILSLVIIVAAVTTVSFFLLFGPPRLLAKTNEPAYCVSCHVMESQYESWIHAGAHRRKQCVECHLPYENIPAHYIWKTIDGVKDALLFYSGRVPENIKLTSHGQKVVQKNCVRCHEDTVLLINTERKCWECHRRITHKGTGTMQTF